MSLFSESALRRIAVITLAFFCALATGCYNKVHIKPDEAKKLDDTYSAQTGFGSFGGDTYTVHEKSVVKLEKIDGRIYQMVGAGDLILTTSGGKEVTFEHPLAVEVDSKSITASGKNRAKTEFQRDSIEKVVVKDLDERETRGAITAGSLAVGAVAGLVTWIIISSNSSNTTY